MQVDYNYDNIMSRYVEEQVKDPLEEDVYACHNCNFEQYIDEEIYVNVGSYRSPKQ